MSRVKVSDVAYVNKSNFIFEGVDFINYLDTGSITNNTVDGYQYLSTAGKIPSRARRAVTNGTIVYSSVRPRQCHFGILKNIPENTVVSTGFVTLDAKEEINPYYLYNCLISQEKIEYIAQIADTSVSSYPSINPDDLGNMEIEIIDDYNEQCKIAELLEIIDEKIENNSRVYSKIESLLKTVFDYWFLQYEFPNELGKPYKTSGGKLVWNDLLKREVPAGWDAIQIGKILEKVPKTESVLRDDYKNGTLYAIVDQSKDYICGYTDDKEKLLAFDDAIVFGDHTNVAKYVNFPFARGADGTQIIRSNNNRLPNYLLYLQIGALPVIEQGYSRHFKFLKEQIVFIPQKSVSDLFQKYVQPMTDYQKKAVFENKELFSLRRYLLPLLMNGQINFVEDENEDYCSKI